MRRILALILLTALVPAALRVAHGQAAKEAREANKLAREGAEAARNQQWDKAIDLLRKATNLEHKYGDELSAVYQQRGYAAANEQRFQDAINDYGEAIKLTPNDARVYEQRAAVEMKTNDYDKALADYSQALRLKPNDVRLLLYRSYIYELKGDLKSSMADTEKVLKLDPNNREAKARKDRLLTREAAQVPFTPIVVHSPTPTPHPRHNP